MQRPWRFAASRVRSAIPVLNTDFSPLTNRKVYHITTAGQKELRDWLTTPLPPMESRVPTLIQVFFAGQLDDEEILEMFRQEVARLRALLGRYAQVPQGAQVYVEKYGTPREAFFWMLTLECGVKSAEAQLAWTESVIERIQNKQHPSS